MDALAPRLGTVGVRGTTADGGAAFEIFNSLSHFSSDSARYVAEKALRRLVGVGTPATLVCAFDLPASGPMTTSAYFEAVATQTSVAVAMGTVFRNQAGMPIGNDYQVIVGPRPYFETLARHVFLPVLSQFQSATGAASTADHEDRAQ